MLKNIHKMYDLLKVEVLSIKVSFSVPHAVTSSPRMVVYNAYLLIQAIFRAATAKNTSVAF